MLTQGADYMRTQRKHATYHPRRKASRIQPDALQSWAVKRLTGGCRNHQTSPPLYPLETTQSSLSSSSAEMSPNILWAAHFPPSFGACPPPHSLHGLSVAVTIVCSFICEVSSWKEKGLCHCSMTGAWGQLISGLRTRLPSEG